MPNSDAGWTGAGLGSSRRSSGHLTKDAPETLEVVDRQYGSTRARTRIDRARPSRAAVGQMTMTHSAVGPVGLPWRYVPFVTAAAEFGRQFQARYNFRGAAAELEATVPLTSDEQVLLTGVARLSSARLLPRPVVLRLTSSRLVTLTHRAFGADQVLELPRSVVSSIVLDDDVLAVTRRNAASASSVLSLQPWTGRTRVGSPLRDMAAVAQHLDQWLAAN